MVAFGEGSTRVNRGAIGATIWFPAHVYKRHSKATLLDSERISQERDLNREISSRIEAKKSSSTIFSSLFSHSNTYLENGLPKHEFHVGFLQRRMQQLLGLEWLILTGSSLFEMLFIISRIWCFGK